MKLLAFCEAIYKDGNRPLRNGFTASQNNIILKVGIVYNNFMDGFSDTSLRFPPLPDLLDHEVSEDGGFSSKNLADLIRIIFDVITDQNLTPELWQDRESLSNEISQILAVLYFGPFVHLGQTGPGPIEGNDYDSVRAELLAALKKSRNPLSF